MRSYILSLDAGTTSSRAILFRRDGTPAAIRAHEFPQIFPESGWVEHDPIAIRDSQFAAIRDVLASSGVCADEIAAIGITNQRETTVVWDRATGKPVCNAIVWQCRRTAARCDELKSAGKAAMIREKTGLLIDPYFSATKLEWILDHHPDVRERAERGEICFGTVDSWLMYCLSGGKIHATDLSNASRTMLFNIHTLKWDDELLSLFRIPRAMLPEVKMSCGVFGYTDEKVIGFRLPIGSVIGDQQASLFGQGCFARGDAKNTYGTGAFLLMNTGDTPVSTDSGLITTVAWGIDGRVTYALEGSVFVCGAAIQWLRDGLGLIKSAAESEAVARSVPDTGGVYLVPAFVGLGAPYWDAYARGTIYGITRGTTSAHIVRAAVESMAYGVYDLLELMKTSTGADLSCLRVDGGAAANSLLLSFQADLLGVPVCRPDCLETTAYGAAALAGLGVGYYTDVREISACRGCGTTVAPSKNSEWRQATLNGWHDAVARARGRV